MSQESDEQLNNSNNDMPSQVGYLILDRLHEVIEHVIFGAVCKRWNIIAKEYHLLIPSYKVLPMVFVPSVQDNDATTNNLYPRPESEQHCLISRLGNYCLRLLGRKKYQMPRIIPLSYHGKYYSELKLQFSFNKKRYIGVSNGWIAVQNEDYITTLIYPFGKEVCMINLPALYNQAACKAYFKKFIISPQSTTYDYIVAVIYGLECELATIKSGEADWVYISPLEVGNYCSGFDDIIFRQGELYAVSKYYMIMKVDIIARPPVVKETCFPRKNADVCKRYIVESTSSDLYVLQQILNSCTNKTVKFNLDKLENKKGELSSVEEAKSINKDTFFVGYGNSSMAIKTEICLPNSIFFIYNDVTEPEKKVCYYNIEDGTVKTLFNFCSGSDLHPLWILPQKHFA